MKNRQRVGLIAAGNVVTSLIASLPKLRDELGPVKATSFRLASRISNSLGGGRPVPDFEEFNKCSLVLISVPDGTVSSTIAELAAANVAWRRKSIVLCHPWRDSSSLDALAATGAAVASLSAIPGFENHYLAEGDRLATLELRRLADVPGYRMLLLARGAKPFYTAALLCTEGLLLPLLAAADQCLKHAGVPASLADGLLERWVEKTSRAYQKGRRKSWSGPLADGDHPTTEAQLCALMERDKLLAKFARTASRMTLGFMERDPDGIVREAPPAPRQ